MTYMCKKQAFLVNLLEEMSIKNGQTDDSMISLSCYDIWCVIYKYSEFLTTLPGCDPKFWSIVTSINNDFMNPTTPALKILHSFDCLLESHEASFLTRDDYNRFKKLLKMLMDTHVDVHLKLNEERKSNNLKS